MSSKYNEQAGSFRWYVWLLFLYIPVGALLIYILREIQYRKQSKPVEIPEGYVLPEKATQKKVVKQKTEKPDAAKTKTVEKKTSKPDDLRKIEGIGPKISRVLVETGIDTYAKIAAMTAKDIKDILEKNGVKIAFPETWPQQAKLAAKGDWDGLTKLQDSLKGGRKA